MNKIKKVTEYLCTGMQNEINLHLKDHCPAKLLYHHIPKCGGTTLTDLLRKNYVFRRTYNVNRGSQQARVAKFKSFSQKKRYTYELIYGHLANRLYDDCSPDMKMITLLRDPAERLVSHYYFVKETPGHYLHQTVQENHLSLMDYLRGNISTELNNFYTVHFSGHPLEYVLKHPDASVADATDAVANRYHLVGFLDHMNAFIDQVCQDFGLSRPEAVPTANKTKSKPSKLDESILAEIRELNAIDYQLYSALKKTYLGFKG